MLTAKVHKIAVYIAFVLLTAWLLFGSLLPAQTVSGDHAGHEPANEESEKLSIDRRIARYTLWLAGFTLVLAVSTIGLWIATALILRHSRETAKRQLRAYVGLEKTNLVELHGPQGPRVELKVKNFGLTPALDVTLFSGLGFGPYPINQLEDAILPNEVTYRPKYPLNPSNIISQFNVLNRQLTQPEIDATTKGSVAFYLIGRIDYKDTFDRSHWYRFKMFLGGRALIEHSTSFSWWHEGNETDES
jgi:hypothetical protein